MSTITQKIAAILGIKAELKDAINAKGGSLTASTPFADYPAAVQAIQTQSAPVVIESQYYGIQTDANLKMTYSSMKSFITQIKDWPNVNISEYGFYGHTGLTSIPDIGGSVGSYAFAGCTGLTELKILSGANLQSNAFQNCTGLRKVVIDETDPSKITMGYGVFSGVTKCTTTDPTKLGEFGSNGYGYKSGSGMYIEVPDGYVKAFRQAWYELADCIFNASGSDETYHDGWTDPTIDPGDPSDPGDIEDF